MHNIIINSQNSNNNHLKSLYTKNLISQMVCTGIQILVQSVFTPPQIPPQGHLLISIQKSSSKWVCTRSLTCPLGRENMILVKKIFNKEWNFR